MLTSELELIWLIVVIWARRDLSKLMLKRFKTPCYITSDQCDQMWLFSKGLGNKYSVQCFGIILKSLFKSKNSYDYSWATFGENCAPFYLTSGHTPKDFLMRYQWKRKFRCSNVGRKLSPALYLRSSSWCPSRASIGRRNVLQKTLERTNWQTVTGQKLHQWTTIL